MFFKKQSRLFTFLFKQDNFPIILAPVETTTRDLYWKVRLYAELDKFPFLIIGRYEIINSLLRFSKGCIYLGKNIIQHGGKLTKKRTKELVNICDYRNHKVFFIDEEGGLFNLKKDERKKYFLKRHALEIMPKNTKLLVWGEEQFDLLKEKYGDLIAKEKIILSGTPRFRPINNSHRETIKKRMHDTYGKYILMNSNFSLQTTWTLSEIFSNEIWLDIFEENDHRLSEIKTLNIFLGIIDFLNNILKEDVNILIKVHPAEDIRYYEYLSRKFQKVKIVGKTSLPVSDYIIGSIYSISTRCTTAIESKIFEVPSISIGNKDEIPLNASEMNVYNLNEFKYEFFKFLDDLDIKKKNYFISNENYTIQTSNLNIKNIQKKSLKSCMMLDENIRHFEIGKHKEDLLINKIKLLFDERIHSKGFMNLIFCSFFFSSVAIIKDCLKSFIFLILKRYPKRKLKFKKMDTDRLAEEMNFCSIRHNYKIINLFGQVCFIFRY